MESECENTRRWLLQAERYEDVEKFDSSDEMKEKYLNEMIGIRSRFFNKIKTILPQIPDTDDAEILRKHIYCLHEIVKMKDEIIDLLNGMLNG